MSELLTNKSLSQSLGQEGKKIAEKRFNIDRFAREWEETFQMAIKIKTIMYEKENSVYK